jgi:hypothetical protein
MAREGFSPRKVGATEDRFNVIGTYGGLGTGKNLLFTAHLDTESPTRDPDLDVHKYSPATLADPEWERCWLEDGVLRGYPIANDRGPMSCFLIAAKALKTAGYGLAGKMYLTACPGEIGPEPIEEHRGIAISARTSAPTTCSITAASRPTTPSPPRAATSAGPRSAAAMRCSA